jgi:nucleotide-binding universal stress UspA family protein
MRLKHLLAPTDFGESSQRAEDLAAELAAKFEAKLTLLHVWSVPAPTYAEALTWPITEIEAAARDALARANARLKEKHAKCESVLAAGIAWDRILETAKQREVDMIVIGTHGRRGLPRFLLGSVAEKVVRLSPVPVLTVGSESGVTPIRKILLPVDLGPASEAAIEETAALASAFGAEVTVLHVYEAPIHVYPGVPYVPIYDTSLALEKSARGAVDVVVHQLAGRVARVTGLVRQGSAWRNINEVAQELGADLIVLGTHGRRGVPRAFIGSVAEKVVRTSPVPVLTVHAPDSATPMPTDVPAP